MKWTAFAALIEIFLAAAQVLGQSNTGAPPTGNGNVSISLLGASSMAADVSTTTLSMGSSSVASMAGSSSMGTGAPSVMASSTAAATSQPTSLPTSLPIVISTSTAMASTSTSMGPIVFATRPPSNTSLPVTVAIICACLMFLLVIILFIIVALILKHLKVAETKAASSIAVKGRPGDGAFYGALNPQSNQALVGSMSSQSFASNASDPHLNMHAQGAHYNRGYEGDRAGPAAVNYVQEGVEMGGRKRVGQSKA